MVTGLPWSMPAWIYETYIQPMSIRDAAGRRVRAGRWASTSRGQSTMMMS